ncbi:hypothetical protein EBR57_02465 [bacterium]|nr:hypothetical protein [bacterium]
MKHYLILCIFISLTFTSNTVAVEKFVIPQSIATQNLTIDGVTVKFNDRRAFQAFEKMMLIGKSDPVLSKQLEPIADDIRNGKLGLMVAPSSNSSIRVLHDSVKFFFHIVNTEPPGTPFIQFNPIFFEILKKQESLALSLLAYEASSASLYRTSPEQYRQGLENPVENYLYAMDSLYLHARFLAAATKKTKAPLSKYERLILQSHKDDNLNLASQMIFRKDMSLAYEMVGIQYEKTSENESITKLEEIGQTVLNICKMPPPIDPETSYKQTLLPWTYLQLGPQILVNIHFRSQQDIPFEISQYPKMQQLFAEIEAEFVAKQDNFRFHDEFLNSLEADISSRNIASKIKTSPSHPATPWQYPH